MTEERTYFIGDACEPPHKDTTSYRLFREPACEHDDVQAHSETTRTRCGLCGAELRWVVPVEGLIDPGQISYKAAEPAIKEFVGWMHTNMRLHPKTYDELVRAYLRMIVDAAVREVDDEEGK